jgi:type II secretory pathway component GspD/PulD (secretin)
MIAAALLLAATAGMPAVTLDVKDTDLIVVLRSMQKQCGIRNLVIDPDVKGTVSRLKFNEVPCDNAFKVVFGQFGLTGQVEQNVTTVEPRRN